MDDPRRFLPLSAQQFQILLALTDADRHGYGIILDIEDRTRGALRIGTGTLCLAIAGLLADELIAEAGRGAARSQDDARRKYLQADAARPRRASGRNQPARRARPRRPTQGSASPAVRRCREPND